MAKNRSGVYSGSYLTGHRGPFDPGPPMPSTNVPQSCVPPLPKPKELTVTIIVE
jgi:hypothetical protein